jgi:glycosyltransferase involved in cell wall biosynthesis
MPEPAVSVVTPFYNTARYLGECIESVLAQRYGNYEYLLVNNQSTDGSREIAMGYCRQNSRLRLIDNAEFVGQVENYNGAVAQISSRSKYLKVVQADDWIYPDCVARMVDIMERDPRIGLVSSYRLLGDRASGYGIQPGVWLVPGKEACTRMLRGECFPLGSPTTVLYRADVVRSRHPFYRTGRYHEDTEAGYEILLEHDLGFVHEVLSFTRIDNESRMSKSRAFNGHCLDNLLVLEQFGPKVLDRNEFLLLRAQTRGGYYRFLGQALLRLQSRQFWKYHRNGLATIGVTFRRRDVLREAAIELVRLAFGPFDTLSRSIANVRRRVTSAQARENNSDAQQPCRRAALDSNVRSEKR